MSTLPFGSRHPRKDGLGEVWTEVWIAAFAAMTGMGLSGVPGSVQLDLRVHAGAEAVGDAEHHGVVEAEQGDVGWLWSWGLLVLWGSDRAAARPWFRLRHSGSPFPVIPDSRHSGVGRNPGVLDTWIPAYAGMTRLQHSPE